MATIHYGYWHLPLELINPFLKGESKSENKTKTSGEMMTCEFQSRPRAGMINTRVCPWRFIHTNRITALSHVAYLWNVQTSLTFLKTHQTSSLLESSLNHFEPFWRFKLSQWWVFWIRSPNSVTVTGTVFTVAISSKNAGNFRYIHTPLNTIPIFASSSPYIYIFLVFQYF